FEAARRPAQALPGDRLIAEFVGNDMRVWRFLIVVVAILAAASTDARGIVDPQAPATDIERMHAVVAQFAVAPVPGPVPVVMHVVIVKLALGRGALPQVEIQPFRHRRGFAFANVRAAIVVPRAAE